MRKPVLTIFYQYDPWHSTIGGIQTIIHSFIKYAPDDFLLRFVGITSRSNITPGKWHEAEVEGRDLLFMPLFHLQNDDVRHLVPTTAKYTAALLRRNLASDFMHFHRLEPSLASMQWKGDKTLFIHNDITRQIQSSGKQNAILWRRFPGAYFALERLLVNQFNQILSCNSDSLQLYQQRYSDTADRAVYFRNTVDTEVFYPLHPKERDQKKQLYASKLGVPPETRFILFAGRLHPQKDPVLLVQSIAALNEPDVHLLMVGDGELAPQVRSEIERLGLAQQITMLGALSRAEVAELHRFCSLCVLTSEYEGLPLVALEALACGTPIVTTRCGDTPGLLTSSSGVICEERTPTAIALALRQVLQHPEQYPTDDCAKVTQPYSAHMVIGSVYDSMLKRWEERICVPTAPSIMTRV